MNTYILWDIDGTLIYNNAQGGGLYVESIEHVTGVRPTERVPNPHGMTEGQLLTAVLEANKLDVSHLDAVLEQLDIASLAAHEAGDIRIPTEGAAAAIADFAARGFTNALLTGNGPKRARYKIVAAGYNPDAFDWSHSYFGHRSPTRHHLTADARADLGDERAFIIGDTPKDGEAADTAGIPFIAVATGAYTADELRATNAIVVVDDLVTGFDAVLAAISRS